MEGVTLRKVRGNHDGEGDGARRRRGTPSPTLTGGARPVAPAVAGVLKANARTCSSTGPAPGAAVRALSARPSGLRGRADGWRRCRNVPVVSSPVGPGVSNRGRGGVVVGCFLATAAGLDIGLDHEVAASD
jgi:hypothetical protein